MLFSSLISVYLQMCSMSSMKSLLSFACLPGSINRRHSSSFFFRLWWMQWLPSLSSTNGSCTNRTRSWFSRITAFSLKLADIWKNLRTILATSQGLLAMVWWDSRSRHRLRQVKRQFQEKGQTNSPSRTGKQLCVRMTICRAGWLASRKSMLSWMLQGENSRSTQRQLSRPEGEAIQASSCSLYCSVASAFDFMNSSWDFYVLRSTSASVSITSRRILSVSMNRHSRSLFLSSCARLDFPLPGISIGRTTYLLGFYSLRLVWGISVSRQVLISAMILSSEGARTLRKGISCFLQASLKASILSLSILTLLPLSALLMKVMRCDFEMSLHSPSCWMHSSRACWSYSQISSSVSSSGFAASRGIMYRMWTVSLAGGLPARYMQSTSISLDLQNFYTEFAVRGRQISRMRLGLRVPSSGLASSFFCCSACSTCAMKSTYLYLRQLSLISALLPISWKAFSPSLQQNSRLLGGLKQWATSCWISNLNFSKLLAVEPFLLTLSLSISRRRRQMRYSQVLSLHMATVRCRPARSHTTYITDPSPSSSIVPSPTSFSISYMLAQIVFLSASPRRSWQADILSPYFARKARHCSTGWQWSLPVFSTSPQKMISTRAYRVMCWCFSCPQCSPSSVKPSISALNAAACSAENPSRTRKNSSPTSLAQQKRSLRQFSARSRGERARMATFLEAKSQQSSWRTNPIWQCSPFSLKRRQRWQWASGVSSSRSRPSKILFFMRRWLVGRWAATCRYSGSRSQNFFMPRLQKKRSYCCLSCAFWSWWQTWHSVFPLRTLRQYLPTREQILSSSGPFLCSEMSLRQT